MRLLLQGNYPYYHHQLENTNEQRVILPMDPECIHPRQVASSAQDFEW